MLHFIFAIFLLLFPIVQMKANPLDHFHVCTVASHAHNPHFQQLIASCHKHQIDIKVLGMGKPFPGLGLKFLLMQEYLETLDENEIVMFVDAFDVLIVADKQVILNKFLKMHVPFLIAAEMGCYPYEELANQYLLSPTPFRFINTGTFIGYVGYIKKWLKEMSPFDVRENDQGVATLHFLKNKEFYVLDYHCELFLPLFMVNPEKIHINIHTKSVHNLYTNSEPCV